MQLNLFQHPILIRIYFSYYVQMNLNFILKGFAKSKQKKLLNLF
jgi:hypothetical protein